MSNFQLKIKDTLKNPELVSKLAASMSPQKQEAFKTSLLSIVSTNRQFESIEPVSIISTALIAATLDLPLNQNFSYAYLVPYGGKAQFQMGYKGFIQLAQRSGQYKIISASKVCEGQIKTNDPLKGMEFDWTVSSNVVVGYVAYFQLLNGFESYFYMTNEQLEEHAKKYSQSYKSNSSVMNIWKSNFDAMATKTVLKLLLSKYGLLSVEMQKAVEMDQSSSNGNSNTYIDNSKDVDVTPSDDILEFITEAESLTALESVRTQLTTETQKTAFAKKETELKQAMNTNPVSEPLIPEVDPTIEATTKLKALISKVYTDKKDMANYIDMISTKYNIDGISELTIDNIVEQIADLESQLEATEFAKSKTK
jgi:recombination protein RecT